MPLYPFQCVECGHYEEVFGHMIDPPREVSCDNCVMLAVGKAKMGSTKEVIIYMKRMFTSPQISMHSNMGGIIDRQGIMQSDEWFVAQREKERDRRDVLDKQAIFDGQTKKTISIRTKDVD